MRGRAPIPLTVAEVERLDPQAPQHQTLRITVEGECAGEFEVYPNDVLSIRWHNDPTQVEHALDLLGERPSLPVQVATVRSAAFPGPVVTTSVKAALTEHVELQTTSEHLLKRYGFAGVVEHNAAENERYRAFHRQASGELAPGNDKCVTDLRAVSLLSVIEQLRGSRDALTVADIVALQDRVFPRPYTMSGYQRLDGGRFRASITVSLVQKSLLEADGESRTATGRATGYLASLRPGDLTAGLVLPDRHLFPQTLGRTVPLIIVCTGAGVAGPLALLRAGYRGGPLWFVYGVRNWQDHGLYRDELQRFAQAGVISRLDIAESRPTMADRPRRYVQDVLVEESDELMAWLRDGAHLFMGGRLSMAVAVNQALREILIGTGACSSTEAADMRLGDWYDTLRFQASVSRV